MADSYPWQEYDCPIQQADADLHDEDMVYAGQTFRCTWCANLHPAEIVETFDHESNSVALPADADGLAALWFASIKGGAR